MFDPSSDKDRPKIGEEIEYEGNTYVVAQVSWTTFKGTFPEGSNPLNGNFDLILYRDSETRPSVYWQIYCYSKTDLAEPV